MSFGMRGRGGVWTGESFDFAAPNGRARVKYRDRGWLQIVNGLKNLDQSRVKVGVVGENANIRHPSGLAMADIATINEFGTEDGHVPARSFLRNILRSPKAWAGMRNAAMNAVRRNLSGRMTGNDAVLRSIGHWAVGAIRDAIANTIPPPQAKATIAKKGHDATLRETFSLYNAINFVLTRAASHGKGDYITEMSATKVDVGRAFGPEGTAE